MKRIIIPEALWQELNNESFALAYKNEIIMRIANELKEKCNDETLIDKYTQIHDLARASAREMYEFNNKLIDVFDY